MNKVLIGLFISLGLMGCDKENSSYNVSYTNEQTKEDSDGKKTEVVIQESFSSNGGTTMNSIGDINIIGDSQNTIAIGKDSVSMSNGRAFMNGKELDMDLKDGVSISYSNNGVLINGQEVKYKDGKSSDSKNKVEIKLTGKEVRIPINPVEKINSSYTVEQKCSEDGKNYLVIDEALKPYLNEGFEKGNIHLKNGNYRIDGQPKIILETEFLESVEVEKGDKITLTCVSKNRFIATNSSISSFIVKNIDSKDVRLDNDGTGKIFLEGKNIDKLIANNSGVGNITVNVPVNDAVVENNGVGSVNLDYVKFLDAENNGIGTINVKKVDKVVRKVNSGIGSINY